MEASFIRSPSERETWSKTPISYLTINTSATLAENHHRMSTHHGYILTYPIGSMYAIYIYGNIYHQYTPNVSIYIYIPYMDPMGILTLFLNGDDHPIELDQSDGPIGLTGPQVPVRSSDWDWPVQGVAYLPPNQRRLGLSRWMDPVQGWTWLSEFSWDAITMTYVGECVYI